MGTKHKPEVELFAFLLNITNEKAERILLSDKQIKKLAEGLHRDIEKNFAPIRKEIKDINF